MTEPERDWAAELRRDHRREQFMALRILVALMLAVLVAVVRQVWLS